MSIASITAQQNSATAAANVAAATSGTTSASQTGSAALNRCRPILAIFFSC
jgi:hypothetical protein